MYTFFYTADICYINLILIYNIYNKILSFRAIPTTIPKPTFQSSHETHKFKNIYNFSLFLLLIRGGYGFFRDQTLFSTPILNIRFSDLIKSNQFCSQRSNIKQFFSPFISFGSPHTSLSS